MKIGIIANKILAQFIIKTFEEIGYESYLISVRNTPLKILHDFKNCNIIYAHAPYEWKVYLLAKLFHKKVVTHWIGSDGWLATTKSKFKYYAKFCNFFTNKQLVVSSSIKEEIESIGIKNIEVIPILPKFISRNISKMEQKNDNFTVLSYIPTKDFDFYGGKEILKLAKDDHNIKFWILTRSDTIDQYSEENVTYLGMVPPNEMDNIYNKCHILIRYVKHDGMPKMLIEALQKGLQVIYNFPFPFVNYCTSLEQIKKKLYEIKENYHINHKGRAYVLKNYRPEDNQILFKRVFDRVIQEK
ncbi:MAG: hypothetical protein ACFFDN_10470 [Candidatus Hodarchaeota archaeon]